METYIIFYLNGDCEETMHTHCLADSMDWLFDHGYPVVAIRDMITGETYRCATNVRRIENE